MNIAQGTQVHWLVGCKFNKTVVERQDNKAKVWDEKENKESKLRTITMVLWV